MVVTATRPADADLPYSVLCGPFSTSTPVDIDEIGEGLRLVAGSDVVHHGEHARLHRDAEGEGADAADDDGAVRRLVAPRSIVTEGENFVRSENDETFALVNRSALMTVSEIGTFWTFSMRFSAVTTTVSTSSASAAPQWAKVAVAILASRIVLNFMSVSPPDIDRYSVEILARPFYMTALYWSYQYFVKPVTGGRPMETLRPRADFVSSPSRSSCTQDRHGQKPKKSAG